MSKSAQPSRMRKLFGGGGRGGREPAAPTTGAAIQNLRDTEDMLMKKQEFLEAKIEAQVGIAKTNAKSNKRVALNALKHKKRLEGQLQQIDGTLTTIEQQRQTLEAASTNTHVFKNMSDGAKALKQAHNNMDVDKVNDMMDDIAEQRDVAEEIANAISQPVGYQDYDEDELEDEFNALLEEEEQDIITGAALRVPDVPSVAVDLPDVPVGPGPVAAKKKVAVADEDDMEALAAWAS